MSTEIGIYCRTCKQESGCGIKDFAIAEMNQVIECKAELKILYDKLQSLPYPCVNLGFYTSFDGDIDPVLFVIEHAAHDLYVYDEYGVQYNEKGDKINY